MADRRSTRPPVATVCTLEFGYEQAPPEFDFASDPTAPGFHFTAPDHPWSDIHYAGKATTKYLTMWDNLLQGAGANTAASRTRPRTGGSDSCPQEDKFWSDPDWSFLRDAFLKKAVEHLAPPESDDSGTGSDGPGVFSSANHLGGTEGGLPQMAVPWSFNQFTPQSRVFGGGTWPGPGSGIWHGDNYTGKKNAGGSRSSRVVL